ncbi:hypothetical protein [Cupriavidus sp. UYPR2.512]|uniref:hypothetical protein n=1 Tax=Cupriavidus sp. UYPR2.512 TaxID=1080187 RepID=UPI00039B6C03|nr:hypothetical protein [Cupriavidus sp. UYPR2.512]
MAVLKGMSWKSIEALPSGQYWAVPHAPFPPEAGNGHDEVFPSAHCISDGKWVAFFKNGEEVWACNALYAAAHFDFSAVSTNASASTAG